MKKIFFMLAIFFTALGAYCCDECAAAGAAGHDAAVRPGEELARSYNYLNDGYVHCEEGDYAAAVKSFQAAAADGNPEAFFQLGRMYEEGIGVHDDSVQALKNYYRAKKLGYEYDRDDDSPLTRFIWEGLDGIWGHRNILLPLGVMFLLLFLSLVICGLLLNAWTAQLSAKILFKERIGYKRALLTMFYALLAGWIISIAQFWVFWGPGMMLGPLFTLLSWCVQIAIYSTLLYKKGKLLSDIGRSVAFYFLSVIMSGIIGAVSMFIAVFSIIPWAVLAFVIVAASLG